MSDSRPNIIWIFGDQHRSQALGCHGDPNLHTPNIDRMAVEGVDCRGAVAGFPLCCAFRGSLISGQYPHKCVPGHEHPLPPEQPTVAHAFKDAGYHTAYIGKWHLDGFHERNGRAAMHIVPPERRGGFDHWVGYENNNSQFDCWVHGGEGDSAFHEKLPGYETDALTDLFIEHITEQAKAQQSGGKPFFAALSVQPPHDPFMTTEHWMQRHTPAQIQLRHNVPPIPHIQETARQGLAGYYAQVENIDWNIGRIREALDKAGIAENTILIFFSDHGEFLGSHGQFRKMSPLAEALSIPFIIAGEQPFYGKGRGGNYHPINHVDIAPTSLGLAGIDAPDSMAGTDYSFLWHPRERTQPELPGSAYIQSVIPTGHGNSIDRPWRGIVTEDGWKYVCLEHQPWLMFNNREDEYELHNMAHNPRFKVQRKKLHDRLAQWVRETDDSFPLPEI